MPTIEELIARIESLEQQLKQRVATLEKEVALLRGELGRPQTKIEQRWQEVCRCFREGRGQVSVTEADSYLHKASGYCKKLVVAGYVKGRERAGRGGQRIFVDAGDIDIAVSVDYF